MYLRWSSCTTPYLDCGFLSGSRATISLIYWIYRWSQKYWARENAQYFLPEWKQSLAKEADLLTPLVREAIQDNLLTTQTVCSCKSLFLLDAIASPSTYPCQWVSQWFIVSDLEIAIASPSFEIFFDAPEQSLEVSSLLAQLGLDCKNLLAAGKFRLSSHWLT